MMNLERSLRFRAMNTDVEAIVACDEERSHQGVESLEHVQALFRDVELSLSRFLPESELSALNACAGKPFRASEMLFTVVQAALVASRATNGWFDPTVLPALVAAGYDRSFEQLSHDGAAPTPVRLGSRWQEIQLDSKRHSITLPTGCSLELGGIAKGMALDRAALLLASFDGFAVDAGGDMVLGGRPAGGGKWTIGVEDPLEPVHDLEMLELSDCAVATSSTVHRRWMRGGRIQHHLIDPTTMRPSRSGVLAATVIGQTAVEAETLSKAALLLGPTAGLRLIESRLGAQGLLVLEGGYVQKTAALRSQSRVA
jgi:FAD:protein FMN transferase